MILNGVFDMKLNFLLSILFIKEFDENPDIFFKGVRFFVLHCFIS